MIGINSNCQGIVKLCDKDCRNNYTIGHQTLNILFSIVDITIE